MCFTSPGSDKETMLKINKLHAKGHDKEILKSVNLEVKSGEIHALMGPNGSGKSTLANIIAGNPKYTLTQGNIHFIGKDISDLGPDKISKEGIFLSFQHPKEIEGVSVLKFLKTIRDSKEGKKSLTSTFKKNFENKSAHLKTPSTFLERNLNHNFSGGEKKRCELLQLLTLEPKLCILDEIDSGLDVDALQEIALALKKYLQEHKGSSALIISHYKRIFEYLKPDTVSVIIDGKIVKQGGPELIDLIDKKGFDGFNK